MNNTEIPCASNLLWFLSQFKNEEQVVNVSIDDIMREFNIDHKVANELISDIANPPNNMLFPIRSALNTLSGIGSVSLLL